ncbi:hypothetical protein [Methylorubrum populi]
MRERPHPSVPGRAIIAVIALYALVLQAFLTVVAPMMPRIDSGIICAEHEAPAASDDDGPPECHHACCTQVHAVALQAPDAAGFLLAVWPPRATPLPRREAFTHRARAPPDQGISPRGPPAT